MGIIRNNTAKMEKERIEEIPVWVKLDGYLGFIISITHPPLFLHIKATCN